MTRLSGQCLIVFLNKYQDRIKGPVADYGSGTVQGKEVKRALASGKIFDYVALDYNTGVDLMKPIKGRKFGTGICMDLLEHVTNPNTVANNISNSLKKGALLFVTVPFVWGLHDYPKDYFRFTADGVKVLFHKLKCLDASLLGDVTRPYPKGKKLVNSINRHWTCRVVAVFEKI